MHKNNIKEFRKSEKLTQVKFAKILGITNDYLSSIERGKVTPGFMLAKKIADYFGVTVDEVFFNKHSNKTFCNNLNKTTIEQKEAVQQY